jgi:hypothetical protein
MVKLAENLGKLEGGTLPIGAFNTWFMNSSWEARMAADSAALRLGWRIQNLLFQWQDAPDEFTPQDLAEEILLAWKEFEPGSDTVWPKMSHSTRALNIAGSSR